MDASKNKFFDSFRTKGSDSARNSEEFRHVQKSSISDTKKDYTKFEIARILGARALQLSMDAPLLIKISDEELEKLSYDPLKIAEKEFNEGILPITVKRVLPEMTKKKLKVERRTEEKDEKLVEKEKTEEKVIKEEGEIMELVQPEDEIEQEEAGGGEAEE